MKLFSAGRLLLLGLGILSFPAGNLSAAEVSKSDLQKMEARVAEQKA